MCAKKKISAILFETAILTTVKDAELAMNRRDNVGIGVSIHNFESKSNNMSVLERAFAALLEAWCDATAM